jgi:hypothetical protein
MGRFEPLLALVELLKVLDMFIQTCLMKSRWRSSGGAAAICTRS